MKRILLAFAVILGLTLYSCGGYSVDDIKAETQVSIVDSISENFDISPNNIEVTSYTLIQETNSVYTDGFSILSMKWIHFSWDIKIILLLGKLQFRFNIYMNGSFLVKINQSLCFNF